MNKTAYDIIIKPVITERSNLELSANRYTFNVNRDANKIEIRKAVEEIYKVKVLNVNTVNCKGKTRRYGKVAGKMSDWKKAIVTLKAGEKIDAFVA
jgi:large subunit ribosomal protein L23